MSVICLVTPTCNSRLWLNYDKTKRVIIIFHFKKSPPTTHKLLLQLGAFAAQQTCMKGNKKHLRKQQPELFGPPWFRCQSFKLFYYAWIDNSSRSRDIIRISLKEHSLARSTSHDGVPKRWEPFKTKSNKWSTNCRTVRAATCLKSHQLKIELSVLKSTQLKVAWLFCLGKLDLTDFHTAAINWGGYIYWLWWRILKLQVWSWAQRWVRRRLNCWSKPPQVSLRTHSAIDQVLYCMKPFFLLTPPTNEWISSSLIPQVCWRWRQSRQVLNWDGSAREQKRVKERRWAYFMKDWL